MSLFLDLPAETKTALEAKATRLGMPLERYVVNVLRHDVESNANSAFIKMLDDSAPRIAAGTLRPLTSEDITQTIADARP